MKLLVIMRGVPGSGKSTLAQLIAYGVKPYTPENGWIINTTGTEKWQYTPSVPVSASGLICSADDYFLDYEGSYNWNPFFVTVAHAECRAKVTEALTNGRPLVIIDNTHIKRWMFSYAIDLAKKFGYLVWECEVGTTNLGVASAASDAKMYSERNRHNVSEESILSYMRKWQP